MSHTKHVFVVNTADGTGMQTTENSLGANDLGVYDNDEFQTTIAALNAGDTFQLANSQYSAPRFNFSDVVKVSDVDGTSGTQQITFITLDDGTANDEAYEVKIIDVSEGREKFAIATFEVAAGTSAADADGAMADLINASKRDVFKDIVATADDGTGSGGANVAGVIKITSPTNKNLRFACNDASAVNATGTAVALVPSVGTVADVNAEFEDGLPFLGVTNIAGPNVVKPVSNASGQYDRVSIFVRTDQVAHGRTDLHEIAIYVKSDNNEIIADLVTLFGYTTATTQS